MREEVLDSLNSALNLGLNAKKIIEKNLFKKIDRLIYPSGAGTTTMDSTQTKQIIEPGLKEFTNDKEGETRPGDTKIIPPLSTNSPENPGGTKSTVTSATNKEKPIPREEEKTVIELFGEPKEKEIIQESTGTFQPKTSTKIDFPKLNEHRHNIGELGELYILEKEQNYLISRGKVEYSKDIVHVASKSDSEGYDIISFTDSGEKKYIEVKTTTGNQYEPFYLSNSEMEAMERLKNYWIYRVYNFNLDLKKGDFYKIDCSKELEAYYHIKASSFKVTPRL